MEEQSQHTAQHNKLPLGKVDYACGIVNDGKAQPDDGVDSTGGEAGKGVLQYLIKNSHGIGEWFVEGETFEKLHPVSLRGASEPRPGAKWRGRGNLMINR
jgi:hypothetical protein